MNHIRIAMLTSILTSSTHAAQAHPDRWQCTATDTSTKTWTIIHQYQRSAINLALDACKKQSAHPEHCRVSKEACDSLTNGHSNQPAWQCTALDQAAKPWLSNRYTHRDDAAIAAKAYCKENSQSPGSCYVNLITCKNVNSHP